MSIDIEWISKLARGASRGPWTRSKAGHIFAANDKVAECPPCQGHRGERNAKFIAAADPAAILALVERVREAEAREQALAIKMARIELAWDRCEGWPTPPVMQEIHDLIVNTEPHVDEALNTLRQQADTAGEGGDA